MTNALLRTTVAFLTLGIGFSLPAAEGKKSAVKPTPEALAARVKEIFRERCLECHGGSSTAAGIKALDHSSLLAKKAIVPGKPEESKAYLAIIDTDESVRMPQDQTALAAQDIESVRLWILAGAPPFPADVQTPSEVQKDAGLKGVVGVDYVLKQILQHVQKLTPTERVNTRYFSCNHLLARGATRAELDLQKDAFAKAVNHLSRQPQITKLTVVDPEVGTIFALSLRDTGWDAKPYREVVDGKPAAVSRFNLYDLVLLDYPYGVIYEDSPTMDALLTDYVIPAKLVRPIPYVRTDWFCGVATQPPLYHDLLQLPHDLESLEKELNIDSAANVETGRVQRAGMAVSGVSRNNRAVERHEGPQGMYWKSIDYITSRQRENIFTDPIHLEGTGGEFIFRLPNGMHGYYVSTSKGVRLDAAPTEIVTDKFAEDKIVRNGLACIRCHDQGVKDFTDDVRPAVEGIPASAGINRRLVLELYPPQKEMDAILTADRNRFLTAMEKVLGHPQVQEPLIPVTQRFLDGPLHLASVTGELGLSDPADLKVLFKQPTFAALGLVPLVNRGVVRRDMWEDYFDQVVRSLGVGVPVVPLDGVIRRDFQPVGSGLQVNLTSTKKNNVFAPGDELAFIVENKGDRAIFVELIGTGTQGEMVVLVPPGKTLAPGAKLRFPEKGSLRVQPALGKEQVTLFASEQAFSPATILRGKHIGDRAVHTFYELSLERAKLNIGLDGAKVVKRTLEIETR